MDRVKSYFTSLFKSKSTDTADPFNILVLCNECLSPVHSPDHYHRCVECLEVYDLCNICMTQGKGSQHTEIHGKEHYFYSENRQLNDILQGLSQTKSIESLFFSAFKEFSTKPAFGSYDVQKKKFVYITFGEVFKEIERFASGLLAMGIVRCNSKGIIPHQIFAICSISRAEFFIADVALMFLGITSAPITASDDIINFRAILFQTESETIICSKQVLSKVLTAVSNENGGSKVRYVICMDETGDTVLSHKSVNLLGWKQVCDDGEQHLVDMDSFKTSNDSIFTLIYTSGTTGTPKGCIFTRQSYYELIKGTLSISSICEVWLAFHPPSHQMERRSVLCNMCSGMRVAFYRGDMGCIMEDISLVRPTLLACTPRFWSSLYQHYRIMVDKEYSSICESSLQNSENDIDGVRLALGDVLNSENIPIHEEQTLPEIQTPPSNNVELSNQLRDIENKVIEQFSGILGGRLRIIVTGGAPTSPEVFKFLKRCFDCFVKESYGATEVGAIALGEFVSPGAEVKLVDVPEMGYLGSDDPPRGEICVRTTNMVKGYYKNEKETEERFVDGFFRTGDIGIIEKSGKIKIIDRKKNLFKLSQGEFVSPERIEGIFCSNSNYIQQMFVYGESLWNNPVCVVVPNREYVINSALAMSHQELSYSQLCTTTGLLDNILMQEIRQVYSKSGLSPWEVPVAVLVEENEFTATNNLLTATFKHCRPRLSIKYHDKLSELHTAAEAKLCALTQNKMLDVVSQVLSLDSSPINLDKSFSQLGGDSLSAVTLMMQIKSELNVEIPIKELLQCSLTQLEEYVNMHSQAGTRQPYNDNSSKKSIDNSLQVDFKAETRLDPALFISGGNYTPAWRLTRSDCMHNSKIVCFLTGASGFLGRYILADILHLTQWQVVCLVRPSLDGTPAQLRLNAEMSKVLEVDVYDNIYSRRVSVLEGDLSKPNLGLIPNDVEFLIENVDIIVHNGARVSFVLPYTKLVAPNVNSLRFLLSVCSQATHRPKHLHFVSTIGVLNLSTNLGIESFLNETSPHDPAYIAITTGYNQSKFVCEILLKRATELGLSASVSRPGLIGPHSVTGDTNLRDWTTYLVYSLFKLGLSPFSSTDSSLNSIISHTPVDYVARSIIYISVLSEDSSNMIPFHLVGLVAKNYSLSQILSIVSDTLSRTLLKASFQEFKDSLIAASKHDSTLRAATLLFHEGRFTLKTPLQASTEQAISLLEPLGVTCPLISEVYYQNMSRFLDSKLFVKSDQL
ncbi:hypothetical protein LOD99_8353 [Oopsacas minuta]|uniref:long-chain-fatty-acid--CoA ligase n=1 Tax=Oopsacas minuta TaxID=111878 RepID=A0AAV7JHR5_9METZ|nr:hypothetical protein LOD99_8353 [Oopsacas minuta]